MLRAEVVLLSLMFATLPKTSALWGVAAPAQTPSASSAQAIQWMEQGAYQQAKEAWLSLCRRDPDNPAIHAQLGLTLSHLGEYKKASTEYRLALRRQPHDSEVQFNLGLAEFKQGHFAAAVTAFRASAVGKPPSQKGELCWA